MDPRVEKILKLPTYQRALILAAIVALIIAGFTYLFYMPAKEEIASLVDRKHQLEKKLAEDRAIADNLPQFKAEYEKMELQLKEALTQLPNKKEIPSLLTSISSLAKDSGLEVLRFQPGGETVRGFYSEVPVSLTLAGTFHEVALFSYAIGNLPRIVNLSNLSLASPRVEEGQAELSVSCLATTFRFIEGAPAQAQGRR